MTGKILFPHGNISDILYCCSSTFPNIAWKKYLTYSFNLLCFKMPTLNSVATHSFIFRHLNVLCNLSQSGPMPNDGFQTAWFCEIARFLKQFINGIHTQFKTVILLSLFMFDVTLVRWFRYKRKSAVLYLIFF